MRNVILEQGKILAFPGHSTAFEVDADYAEGQGCTCMLCRPRGSLLSFVARDNLDRFNRQRLNHQFTAVKETATAWAPAPKVERLQYKRPA